jgi:hypothetical protein
MSDIEREKFEQAVTDRWSDSYSFTRFENGEYMDDFLQQYWIGWQASRQALEGEVAGLKAEIRTERDPSDEYVSFLVFVNGVKSEPYLFIPETLDDTVLDEVVKRINTHPASADVPEKWRTVMKELADDLESEIEARRSGDLDRRIERDLIVVKEARVLLDEQEQDND